MRERGGCRWRRGRFSSRRPAPRCPLPAPRSALPVARCPLPATLLMMGEPRISLVAPTRNERENVTALIAAIRVALDGIDWELVVADDSDDGTDVLVAAIAAADPRVRLLHRAENRGGLAGAVLDGFGVARGTYLCVL